jgi:hypothetical protein
VKKFIDVGGGKIGAGTVKKEATVVSETLVIIHQIIQREILDEVSFG